MRPTGCTDALGGRSELGWRRPYPHALGVWPACILLLAFCWIELVYPNAAVPAHIAWLGDRLFGPDLDRHARVRP